MDERVNGSGDRSAGQWTGEEKRTSRWIIKSPVRPSHSTSFIYSFTFSALCLAEFIFTEGSSSNVSVTLPVSLSWVVFNATTPKALMLTLQKTVLITKCSFSGEEN